MIHRVQHDLWNLRTRRIIEKDESRRPSQRGESGANGFNGKVRIRSGRNFGVENTLGFGLQLCSWVHLKSQHRVLPNEQRQTYTPLQTLVKAHFRILRRIAICSFRFT